MIIAEYYDGIGWKACTYEFHFETTLEAITDITKLGWKSNDFCNYITVEPEFGNVNVGTTFCHKRHPLLLLRLRYKSSDKINWLKEGF